MIVVGGVIPPSVTTPVQGRCESGVGGHEYSGGGSDLLDKLNAQMGTAEGGGGVGCHALAARDCDIQLTARCTMNTPFPVRRTEVQRGGVLRADGITPEEERWQLIDGGAMMMPRPRGVHQQIASTWRLN